MNLFNRLQHAAGDEGAGGEGAGAGAGEGDGSKPGEGNGQKPGAMQSAGEWEYAEGIKGEGDRPEYLSSKYKSVAEQAKAYGELAELQGKYGTNFGAPEGDYELSLPEGVTGEFIKDDPLLVAMQAEAREIGLSQAGFDRLLHKYTEHSASFVDDHDAQVANVVAELGENGGAQLSDLWSRLTQLLPEDQAKALDQVTTSAAAVKALQTLVQSEAILPSGAGQQVGGVTKEEARALRFQVFPEGHVKAGKQMYGADEAHTKKVDELYKQLFPGDDVHIVG